MPVTREEVTVERRPLSADAGQDVTITDDEIRIPVMEEQLLVEKRIVPKEEIVIRKRAVTEEKTVEADLRRERVDYDEDQVRAAIGALFFVLSVVYIVQAVKAATGDAR